MKKMSMLFLILTGLSAGIPTYAADQKQTNDNSQTENKVLAANCAKNCSSCWDQCTKSDDCGTGHNCSTTPCGNRCVAQ